MLFSSIIFLYIFLPASIILAWLAGRRLRNIVLLLLSLFFCAWGGASYTLILIGSILLNYLFGRFISLTLRTGKAKLFLISGIILNVAILLLFKYLNFFADSINILFNLSIADAIQLNKIVFPLAISYYTFHCISYLIDIYRETVVAQKNIIKFSLFVSFFPKLIAGPIVRYEKMEEQLNSRRLSVVKFAAGAERFVLGLGKKVIIANTFAFVADKMFDIPIAEQSVYTSWLGVISYTLQIYFDFAGYSDMAIGIAKIFGFDFPENFNFPYTSRSIQEFWQRWHISLSTWLRDYLFTPLLLRFRNMGKAGIALSLLITFGICGLWHGPNLTFVLWGLVQGFFLALENIGFSKVLKKLWSPLRHVYVMLIVIFGWALFRSDTLENAFGFMKAMLGFGSGINNFAIISFYMNNEFMLCLLFAIIASTKFFPYIKDIYNRLTARFSTGATGIIDSGVLAVEMLGMLLIMVSSTMYLITSSYNPFIYFRF